MALEFVDSPPPANRGRRAGKHEAIAAELKEHPGSWAIVDREAAPAIAGCIKNAKVKAYAPKGSFMAVSRGTGERNKATIYAKYVGNKKKAQ